MVMRLIGQRVVVRMPKDEAWERFYLVGVDKMGDRIWVKRTKLGRVRSFRGIWRVHMHSLFANSGLPAPLYPARLAEYSTNPRRGSMATRKVTRSKSGSTAAKPATTKRTTAAKKPPAEENGDAPKTRKDKLGHLTEAQRRNAAKLIFKMRGDGKPWPEVMEALEAKGWPIPGSMTGRRLLRDYHDEGETVIRERVKSDNGAAAKKTTKAKAATKKSKAADDDEEEEEEDEAPQPKRRVRVRRGAGKKANPS